MARTINEKYVARRERRVRVGEREFVLAVESEDTLGVNDEELLEALAHVSADIGTRVEFARLQAAAQAGDADDACPGLGDEGTVTESTSPSSRSRRATMQISVDGDGHLSYADLTQEQVATFPRERVRDETERRTSTRPRRSLECQREWAIARRKSRAPVARALRRARATTDGPTA